MSNTTDISHFMQVGGHPTRVVPTTDIPDWERILRAKLVLSEALEFVTAMGCRPKITEHPMGLDFYIDAEDKPGVPLDLVEAADACADLRYVVIGSEITLGIPGDDVFAEVHRSNMTKYIEDEDYPGLLKCIKDADGKVMKPPSFEPPDIKSVLLEAGWSPSPSWEGAE